MDPKSFEAGVAEYELDSWRQFFDLTFDNFLRAPAYIYRGQTDYDWPILSSLDRREQKFPQRVNMSGSPPFLNRPPLSDEEHLRAFKHAVRGRRGPNAIPITSDDEYWALGQHYGLATRLTDWTRSPFAALFFAFEQECRIKEEASCPPDFRGVYVLSSSAVELSAATHQAEADQHPRVVASLSDANPRLVNQSGVFLRMPKGQDLESYVRSRFAGKSHQAILLKVKIPNSGRNDCLVALAKMNINYMSLFPDLEGAAKYVNSLWQPGHEDAIAYIRTSESGL